VRRARGAETTLCEDFSTKTAAAIPA